MDGIPPQSLMQRACAGFQHMDVLDPQLTLPDPAARQLSVKFKEELSDERPTD